MAIKNFSTCVKTLLTGSALAILSACSTTQLPPPPQRPIPAPPVPQPNAELPELEDESPTPATQTPTEIDIAPEIKKTYIRNGLTPPHMDGRDIKRLALLLPFSAKNTRLREEAASMLKAAELAVFNRSEADTLIIALDTGGTPNGAKSAAKAAIQSGADVILGPILSGAVKAASNEARRANTPILAFSTDQKAAGNGTYLLSIPPEAEVDRVVSFAAGTGALRFAYLGPDSRYGRRVLSAYRTAVARIGGEITVSESYKGNDITVMQAPARKIAESFEANEELTGGEGPMAFDAILLPEGGTALLSLAPLLPYYSDSISEVQFMGTGLWNRTETVREPALSGGIFAGPDQEAQRRFIDSYDRNYAADPSRLASQAYDAVNFGVFIADGDPKERRQRAEDPAGFYGVNGPVRLNVNGTPDRGLAIYQIQNGRFVIIDHPPQTGNEPS